jgi:plasmid stabilization system protein ParE
MDYKVVYTDPAIDDLRQILERSAVVHGEETERFGDSILNRCDLLGQFPFLGAPVRGMPGHRRLFHSPIYIYYFVDEARRLVEIDHFWHFRRLAPQLVNRR